jgi:hypothetical protein
MGHEDPMGVRSLLLFCLAGMRVRAPCGVSPVGTFVVVVPHQVFSDSPFSVISPAGTLFAYLPWVALWNTNVLLSAGTVLRSLFLHTRLCTVFALA